jgi:hypothetical protein
MRAWKKRVKNWKNLTKVSECWDWVSGLRENKWTKKERRIQSLRRFLFVWSDFLRRSRARKWSLSLVEGEEVGEWFNQDWDSFHLGSDGHKERNWGFISDSCRCFRIPANYCDLLTFGNVDYHSLFVSLWFAPCSWVREIIHILGFQSVWDECDLDQLWEKWWRFTVHISLRDKWFSVLKCQGSDREILKKFLVSAYSQDMTLFLINIPNYLMILVDLGIIGNNTAWWSEWHSTIVQSDWHFGLSVQPFV